MSMKIVLLSILVIALSPIFLTAYLAAFLLDRFLSKDDRWVNFLDAPSLTARERT